MLPPSCHAAGRLVTVGLAGLTGSTLQVVVRANLSGTDEHYYWDDLTVLGAGPGSGSDRTITVDDLPGFIWRCDGADGSDDGSATTFGGLDATVDHLLAPVPAGPG